MKALHVDTLRCCRCNRHCVLGGKGKRKKREMFFVLKCVLETKRENGRRREYARLAFVYGGACLLILLKQRTVRKNARVLLFVFGAGRKTVVQPFKALHNLQSTKPV